MAKSPNGYTDVYCTMYGAVKVFVEFESEPSGDVPRCYECTVCVLQANLEAQPMVHLFRLEGHYLADPGRIAGLSYRATIPPPYSHFQSRAPPA